VLKTLSVALEVLAVSVVDCEVFHVVTVLFEVEADVDTPLPVLQKSTLENPKFFMFYLVILYIYFVKLICYFIGNYRRS
jgi:hypothetical protein